MPWHVFPEHVQQRPAPSLRLFSRAGKQVSLADYRGCSPLVLLFIHGPDCAACRRAVEGFTSHRADYQARAVKVLIVLPGAAKGMPASLDTESLVLVDRKGKTRRAYAALLPHASASDVLLFVLDRYGAPCAAIACPEADKPTLQQEILEWLAFLEIQCPE